MNKNKSKVMKYTSGICGRRMNVALNGELLEEVEYYKYLGSKITVDGGIETKVKSSISDVGKVLERMKVFTCRDGNECKEKVV